MSSSTYTIVDSNGQIDVVAGDDSLESCFPVCAYQRSASGIVVDYRVDLCKGCALIAASIRKGVKYFLKILKNISLELGPDRAVIIRVDCYFFKSADQLRMTLIGWPNVPLG
jgi:hypothetical protein